MVIYSLPLYTRFIDAHDCKDFDVEPCTFDNHSVNYYSSSSDVYS